MTLATAPPHVGGLTKCVGLMSEPRSKVQCMSADIRTQGQKGATQWRDIHLGVRCTPEQSQTVRARAQERGQTVSTYLLSVALEDAQTGAQSTD